jgi:hypothetical protein
MKIWTGLKRLDTSTDSRGDASFNQRSRPLGVQLRKLRFFSLLFSRQPKKENQIRAKLVISDMFLMLTAFKLKNLLFPSPSLDIIRVEFLTYLQNA